MAKRYSKYHSNFILKKRHQQSTRGTIWERDWVTIGDQHQIEKGKRRYFFDGNFLFTDNRIPLHRKYQNFGVEIAKWYYDDVKDAKGLVNNVDVNWISEDLRDYAYYGSCTELVRASIENIAYWLPGRLRQMETQLTYNYYDSETDETITNEYGYEIDNQYGIELYKINTEIDEDVNELRYLAKSWRKFQVDGEDINSYTVNNLWGFIECPWENIYRTAVIITIDYGDNRSLYDKLYVTSLTVEEYGELDNRLQKRCVRISDEEYLLISFEESNPNEQIMFGKFVTNEYYNDLENEEKALYIKYNDKQYVKLLTTSEYLLFVPEESKKIVIKGYNIDAFNVRYAIEEDSFQYIHPKKAYVERFFESLDPFERAMLNRKTMPIYQLTAVTPRETDEGYRYNKETYVWPSRDNYPEINNNEYLIYVERLLSTAQKMDELWCDNLWRSMTHEAIKNYDWSYKRNYSSEDEESNTIGGTRMENIIHIYGRAFDDIKRYIDGIKFTNVVTYDTINNVPDAEISDKLNYRGWDITSTIPVINDKVLSEVTITNNFLEEYVSKNNYITEFSKWFNATNIDNYTAATMDIDFLRQLTLSSKYILLSKGTKDSIEMVMAMFGFGKDDFTIKEKMNFVYPIEYNSYVSDMIYNTIPDDGYGNKDIVPYYGLPLIDVNAFGKTYFAPFYDKTKTYYNNMIYPQSKGGWGKFEETGKYSETLSYLYTVSHIEDLFELNPYTLKNGDIYYVLDISDYGIYDEVINTYIADDTISTEFSKVSHFFMLDDRYNPHLFESWHYIVMEEDSIDFNQTEYDKAMYLANIICTNVGNNPHTGFGEYDDGFEFIRQLSDPLLGLTTQDLTDEQTASLNLLRGFTTTDNGDETENITPISFSIGEVDFDDDLMKIKNFVKTYKFDIIQTEDSLGGQLIDHSTYKRVSRYEQKNYKINRTINLRCAPNIDDLDVIMNNSIDATMINTISDDEYKRMLPDNYIQAYKNVENGSLISIEAYEALTDEDKTNYVVVYLYNGDYALIREYERNSEIMYDDNWYQPLIGLADADYSTRYIYVSDYTQIYVNVIDGGNSFITEEAYEQLSPEEQFIYIKCDEEGNYVEPFIIKTVEEYNELTEEEQEAYRSISKYAIQFQPLNTEDDETENDTEGQKSDSEYEGLVASNDIDYYIPYQYYVNEEYMVIDAMTYDAFRYNETKNFYLPLTYIRIDTMDSDDVETISNTEYDDMEDSEKANYKVASYQFVYNGNNVDLISVKTYDKLINEETRALFDVNSVVYADCRFLYLNDKTLTIINNIDNDLYRNYFVHTILPYITQVIPSTTILHLENFEIV